MRSFRSYTLTSRSSGRSGSACSQYFSARASSTREARGDRQGARDTTRVESQGRDELGTLVTAFNHMLAQVQQRDAAVLAENVERRHAEAEVRQLNAQLEERILQRTAQLNWSNEDLRAAKEGQSRRTVQRASFSPT